MPHEDEKMLMFHSLSYFRHTARYPARGRPATFLLQRPAQKHRVTVEDVTQRSRGTICPGSATSMPPSNVRGRRECRALNAPAASCAKVESTRVVTTGTPIHRHSLHNGFTAYTRSPRCAGLDSHRRPQVDLEVILASL